MSAIRHLLSFAIVLAFFVSTAYAQIPRTMTFQGLLSDNVNLPLPDGVYQVSFAMYDASTGATSLWTETQTVTTVDGVFDVILGSINPFAIAFDRPYWLGITLDAQPEFTPRLALSSVPYAFHAESANGLTPGATGAVLSINGAQGVLTLQGAGGTTVTMVGNAITVTSNGDAIKELLSPDGTIAIANPTGPTTYIALADGSVTQAKLAPGLTIPITGSAGGDLTGTYPNPTIAADAVDNTKLADNAVTTDKIADNAVTTTDISNGAVTTDKVVDGGITTSKIADAAVTSSKLADGSVTSSKLADGSVNTAKLADGSVTSDKLSPSGATAGVYGGPNTSVLVTVDAAGRVTSVETIPNSGGSMSGPAGGDLAGTYPNPTIALNAVTTGKVADFAITTLKLGDNSVTTSKLADNAVTTTKIGNAAVTAQKLSLTGVAAGTYGSASSIPQVTVDATGRVTSATSVPFAGLPPSGAAGGDLTGTYPNPTIASGAVSTTKIADGAITTTKLADGTITSGKIADGSITPAKIPDGTIPSSKLTPTGVVSGTYGNSTNVSQVTIDGAGRVVAATNVPISGAPPVGAAGGDLVGTYPNPTIKALAVDNAKLGDNAVTTPKIVDAAVTTEKLASNAVTGAKIADGSVTTSKVVDGSINNAKIADASVTSAKMFPTGVPAGTYGSATSVGQVTVDAAGRVTTATNIPISGVTPGGSAGGDLTGTYPNPTIASGAVNATKLADNAVTTAKVVDGAVTTSKILDGAISTAKVADGAITSQKMSSTGVASGTYGSTTTISQVTVDAAGRVTAAASVPIAGVPPGGTAGGDLTGSYPNPTIANGAVNTIKLADNAVIAQKIADGSVTTTKIADGSVSSPKLLDGAVSTNKIGDAAVTSTKMSATGVGIGTYGNATSVGQVTVDAAGRVTSATNVPISGVTPGGAAGGDLTGTYPNPTIVSGAVSTAKLADNAVTSTKLADNAVTTNKLAANAVATAKVADGAITSPKMSATGVVPGTYGTSTTVGQVTVDAAGRVTSATNVALAGVAPGGSAGGDLAGTYPNPVLAPNAVGTTDVSDGAITSPKLSATGVTPGVYGSATSSGQVTVDAAGRVTSATNVPIAGVTPGGAAGGDLTGTYPNPTLAPSSVGTTDVAEGAITSTKIADASVTSQKLSPTGVAAGTYGNATTVGQVTVDAQGRVTNATSVTISGVAPGGAAGGDLTGTYPNPVLAPNSVGTSDVVDGAISSTKMTSTGVTVGTYGNATNVSQVIVDAAGRVTSAVNVPIVGVTPGGPAGGDLTGTYPNPTIAAGVVGTTKLADNAVTTAKLSDVSVSTPKVADGAITSPKMSTTGVSIGTYGNATTVPQVTVDAAGRVTSASNVPIVGVPPGGVAGGDLTGTYPNPTIAANAVTTAKVLNGAITSPKMSSTGVVIGTYGNSTNVSQVTVDAAGRVTGASNVPIVGVPPGGAAGGDLTGTYPAPTIAPLAVTTPKVADGAITSPKMSATGVTIGTYGDATNVSQVTVDAAGRVTSATNVAITGVPPGGSAGGDLTGTYPAPTIAPLAVTTAKVASGAITSSKMSATGVAAGTYGNSTNVSQVTVDAAGRVTGATNVPINVPPSGAAGGDLSGTYPNPTIASNAVTTAKVLNGAITSAKMSTTGVTAGVYGDGTNVSQVTVDAAGRVTSAVNVPISGAPPTGGAGGDLTGTYPNPTIASNAVTTAKVVNGAITSAKMSATGVTAAVYGNGTNVSQVTVDAAGRVTSAVNVPITGAPPTGGAGGDLTGSYPNPTIVANAVTTAKIDDNAVTTAKVLNGAITSAKMSATGVTAAVYGNGTNVSQVTVDAAGRVTSAVNVPITGAPPTGGAGGDLTGSYPNPTIVANAVTTAKIDDNAVTTAKVLNGAITSAKMSATGVTAAVYGNGTNVSQVTVDAAGRVTSAVNVPITGAPPTGGAGGDLTGSYPNPTIAANAVTTAKIDDNAVTTAKVLNGAITSAKMSATGVTAATYGNATNVAQVTVDAAGRVTGATDVLITGVTPGGAAGGDLTGSYPNPTITTDAVTTSKVLNGAITSAKMSTTGVTAAVYGNATNVSQVTVDAAGRVTSAVNVPITGVPPGGAAGGDLTGTYPNPTITTDAVTTAKVLNGAITSAKMSTTGVTAAVYGNATNVSQVTVDAAGRVTSAVNVPITGVPPGGAAGGDLTGTYPNPTITTDAVTTAKVLNGAITSAKMSTTGVVAATYGDATNVAQFTVDASGRITSATNVPVSGGGGGGGGVTYAPLATQATATPRSTYLFDIAYAGAAPSATSVGARITSAGTGSGNNATALTLTATVTASNAVPTALNATSGHINIDNDYAYRIESNNWLWDGADGSSHTLVGNTGNSTLNGGSADNTFVGFEAGQQTSSGKENTYIGSKAAKDANSGEHNVAIGFSASEYNEGNSNNNTAVGHEAGEGSSGNSEYDNNTFIGARAGHQAREGSNNTAVGYQSLELIEDGTSNVAIGMDAGDNVKNGEKNVFVGNSTGGDVQDGDRNVALGHDAGIGMGASESDNVALGHNTKFGGSVSNSVAIGSNAEVSVDNAVVIGAISGTNGGTSQNVGIGLTNPTRRLDVAGDVRFGTNGTTITNVIKRTMNFNIPNVVAGAVVNVDIPFVNAAIGSSVAVSPAADLDLVIGSAYVQAAGFVRLRIRNTTAGAIDPAAMDFFITVIQ